MPIIKRPEYRSLCFLALILLAFFGVSDLALAQGAGSGQNSVANAVSAKATFADWALRCEAASSASRESCALVQSLVDEKRPDMVLSVLIVRTPEAPKSLLLRVVTPLNVNLVGRLGLKIDSLDVGRAAFSRCDRFGCLAEVPFDDGLMNQFKNCYIQLFYGWSGRAAGQRRLGFSDGADGI
jgi:invasion protein IalB